MGYWSTIDRGTPKPKSPGGGGSFLLTFPLVLCLTNGTVKITLGMLGLQLVRLLRRAGSNV